MYYKVDILINLLEFVIVYWASLLNYQRGTTEEEDQRYPTTWIPKKNSLKPEVSSSFKTPTKHPHTFNVLSYENNEIKLPN